jgi:hypothetical protein
LVNLSGILVLDQQKQAIHWWTPVGKRKGGHWDRLLSMCGRI